MVEREINVIQRIAYLVSDRRTEPTDDGGLFGLLKFCFELGLLFEFGGHLVEIRRQSSKFVRPRFIDANTQVAVRNLTGGVRKIRDRPRESKYEEDRDQR